MIFSLLGEIYRMGRIEIFNPDNETGYSDGTGSYCLPIDVAHKFEKFISELKSEYPIQINIGSVEQCCRATEKELGVPKGKLKDKKIK